MSSDVAAPPPDDKDWTWVLERRCPDCGFDCREVSVAELAPRTRATVAAWQEVLGSGDLGRRPSPQVWSALEYACHVRDVYTLFAVRLTSMLEQDDPVFPNWDQDDSAVVARYHDQDPTELFEQLTKAGRGTAAVLAGVQGAQWLRPGRRSNGSTFTVESLGRYFLHDVVHHLHDVGVYIF